MTFMSSLLAEGAKVSDLACEQGSKKKDFSKAHHEMEQHK